MSRNQQDKSTYNPIHNLTYLQLLYRDTKSRYLATPGGTVEKRQLFDLLNEIYIEFFQTVTGYKAAIEGKDIEVFIGQFEYSDLEFLVKKLLEDMQHSLKDITWLHGYIDAFKRSNFRQRELEQDDDWR